MTGCLNIFVGVIIAWRYIFFLNKESFSFEVFLDDDMSGICFTIWGGSGCRWDRIGHRVLGIWDSFTLLWTSIYNGNFLKKKKKAPRRLAEDSAYASGEWAEVGARWGWLIPWCFLCDVADSPSILQECSMQPPLTLLL